MSGRQLTAGQVTALAYFDQVGSGPLIARLRQDSVTTLVALGYLKHDRETRHYSITEAGRLVCVRMRQESK